MWERAPRAGSLVAHTPCVFGSSRSEHAVRAPVLAKKWRLRAGSKQAPEPVNAPPSSAVGRTGSYRNHVLGGHALDLRGSAATEPQGSCRAPANSVSSRAVVDGEGANFSDAGMRSRERVPQTGGEPLGRVQEITGAQGTQIWGYEHRHGSTVEQGVPPHVAMVGVVSRVEGADLR